MLNWVLNDASGKIQVSSLKKLYKNIIKLEWFAIAGLSAWVFLVFSTILNL
jgi:hypothetical protein